METIMHVINTISVLIILLAVYWLKRGERKKKERNNAAKAAFHLFYGINKDFKTASNLEVSDQLNEAIKNEDWMKAADLRDRIKKKPLT